MSRIRRTACLFRSAGLLTFAIPGLALLGCANLVREEPYGLAPTDAAFVRQTCMQTMGLRPGLAEFDACAESLADALHRRIDAHQLSKTHEACERQGFADGSPDLARCVVLSAGSASKRHDSEAETAAPANASSPTKRISFFSMDRRVQDEHEKLACAQLGLDPITSEFRDCVIGIKQAIFTAQNPL